MAMHQDHLGRSPQNDVLYGVLVLLQGEETGKSGKIYALDIHSLECNHICFAIIFVLKGFNKKELSLLKDVVLV